MPALDGMRGIAVLAVLVFHAWPVLLPGGFVGVDMFFVLSGFLITTGLVRSIDAGQGVRLGAFWMRRIRRLVPAMVLALVGSTALAWFAFAEFPAKLTMQWLGALTYTSNWVMIWDGNDYFNHASPPLFEHLWSLAIEEQFYVIWPLLIMGLLTVVRPRANHPKAYEGADRMRMGVVLFLAIASAVGMLAGQLAGAPTTRMYFGTDTHAFGLLFGATVAIGMAHVARPEHGGVQPRTGPVRTGLAWAAFAVLLVAFVVVDGTAAYVYLGVLAALSALVALLILHVAQGDRRDSFSRAMSGDFLSWWGRRSYGAYLWHWPLLVIMRAMIPADAPGWIEPVAAGAVLILTALIAEASARWVEEPILHHGFRAAFRGWADAARSARQTRAGKAVVAAVAALAVVVPVAAGAALVKSPPETQLEADIRQSREKLAAAQAEAERQIAEQEAEPEDDGAAPASEPPAKSDLGPTGDESVVRPEFTAAQLNEDLPPSTRGEDIVIFGDSVALSAAGDILAEMPGVDLEADVGDQLRDLPARLEELDRAGQLRPIVVIARGANGTASAEAWDRMLEAVGPDRLLVFVNPHGPVDWIPDVQHHVERLAEEHPDRVVVADWDRAAQHVDEFAPDGVHPRANGQAVYAQLIRLTIDERLGTE